MDRREFLKGTACMGLVAAAGCTTKVPPVRYVAPGEIKAVLLHLGHNMWCDWFPEDMDVKTVCADYAPGRTPLPDTVLRSQTPLWTRVTNHAAAKGLNMVIVDLGEGLVYPSHPELAIEGSWTPDQMRAEIRRLNALGLEVIPKLNFSTTHNGWLKHYRRMLSTPTYYRVCEDLIRDVAEIFDQPRLFHIGYDEETAVHQDNSKRCLYIAVRKGEFWWHDFLHIIRTVEQNGMRAWTWSDYCWEHPEEYYRRCPKSVLQCNWYYDESYGGFDPKTNKTSDRKRLLPFWELEKHGFEQTPCGTNWSGWKRVREKVGADDVIGKLVRLGREVIPSNHLKGFIMAPWASCDTEEHAQFNIHGIDLFAEALKA